MPSNVCRGLALGTAAGCLVLVVLLSPRTLWSQQKSATGELPPFSHYAALPSDPAVFKKLQAARDYIAAEAWGDAIGLLQAVLEMREDVFVPVMHKDKDGKESISRASARAEARRMLAHLPRKGHEFYQTTFGPHANELLDRAKRTNDPEGLAQVVRLYEETSAGQESLRLLGLHHLDRGHHALAARCFRQLLERAGDKLPPLVLFQTALAFHRAGYKASHDRAWKLLTAAAPGGLAYGGKQFSLAELRQRIHASGSRRADGGGTGLPQLLKGWQQPTTQESEPRAWLAQAVRQQCENGRPVLPASIPLVAGDRVVYRSQGGIVAVDLEGGLLWEAPSAWGLDALAVDVNSSPHLSAWIESHLRTHPPVLFENSVLGTLSADRARVFAVEDLPVLPVPNNYAGFRGRAGLGLQLSFAPELTDAVYHNRLLAIDLETGKVAWERGGRAAPGSKDDLADTYFLGPPLPLAGLLYVLTEYDQELSLVSLEATSGATRWSQRLATPRRKLLLDGPRRLHAAPLTHAAGILVCPTNAGAILGFDLLTHDLLWAHAYREDPPAPPPIEPDWRWRGRRWRSTPAEPPPSLEASWSKATPIIQGDKVVFTAADEPSVQCLDLHTGALLWKADRIGGDLYLAGVRDGRVLLVGARQCRALGLEDGKEAWTLGTDEPSGQGSFGGSVYYLPVRSAEGGKPAVHAIDLAKGVIVARPPLPGDQLLGNLIFHRGSVLSQTVEAVTSYSHRMTKKDR
jgi:outer membrane protein assembly factor BamB